MDNQNKNARRKINMKLKTAILMLLVTVLSLSCIVTANAAEIKDDGKYTLILTCGLNGMDGKVDGDYLKMIKFDVADGAGRLPGGRLGDGPPREGRPRAARPRRRACADGRHGGEGGHARP